MVIYLEIRNRELSELQIRGAIYDNSKIIFLFLNENICCDPSLEPSQRDGPNDGSQNVFLWRNMASFSIIFPVTSSYLEH